jgi:hypothetical protein
MSAFPTRPHKWDEPVKRTYTHEDLRAKLELAYRGLCPECKEPASEPCPCFETEEREQ